MSKKEHMLAIVEPRTGGDVTLDIAKRSALAVEASRF